MSFTAAATIAALLGTGWVMSATQSPLMALGTGAMGFTAVKRVYEWEDSTSTVGLYSAAQNDRPPATVTVATQLAIAPTIAPAISPSISPTIANTFSPSVFLTSTATPQSSPFFDADLPLPVNTSVLTGEQVLSLAVGYPAVLVYGAQGSGKSTVAKWIVQQRALAGHTVNILDPHQIAGHWSGIGNLNLIGRGMDYKAIDDALREFRDLIRQRYERLSSELSFSPAPITIVAEEFTNWSSHCNYSGSFWDMAMSDIRKANAYALFVSHGRNLSQLGGGRGAKTRDSTLFEIQLFATLDPATGESRPTMTGTYKFPGQQPIGFDVPKLTFEEAVEPEAFEPETIENSSEKYDPLAIPEECFFSVCQLVTDAPSREALHSIFLSDTNDRAAQITKLWDICKTAQNPSVAALTLKMLQTL
jgi:hypothetical protein